MKELRDSSTAGLLNVFMFPAMNDGPIPGPTRSNNGGIINDKYDLFIYHDRGTKKNSESPTGIESITSQIPAKRCND